MSDLDAAFSSGYCAAVPGLPVLNSPDEGGEWVTEAVYGEPLRVLEQQGEWARVLLPLQRTSLHDAGYPGWSRCSGIAPAQARPAFQTTATRTTVVDDGGRVVMELPCGGLLRRGTGELANGLVPVELESDLQAYVRAADVSAWPIRRAGRAELLGSLSMWTDQPYVWGGTNTVTGSDCSGLTYRSYQRAGITLPRDADDQYNMAPEQHGADLDGILPGDLVFFRRSDHEPIFHVGVYTADRSNLSANQRAAGISTDPIDASAFTGWARYIP